MDENEYDYKEVALQALILFGSTCEAFAEQGLAHPFFYRGLEVAIQMAEYLDEDDLVVLLKSVQIEIGEGIQDTLSKIEEIKERLDKEQSKAYNPTIPDNKEDN